MSTLIVVVSVLAALRCLLQPIERKMNGYGCALCGAKYDYEPDLMRHLTWCKSKRAK